MAEIEVVIPKASNVVEVSLHGPVTVDVEAISQQSLQTHYHLDAKSAGLSIHYRGHKEDLLAAGCLKFSGCMGHFHSDGHGGAWYLSSKAGPGKRGFVRMSYYTANRAFAASLPSVLMKFPEALFKLDNRPSLKLVAQSKEPDAASDGNAKPGLRIVWSNSECPLLPGDKLIGELSRRLGKLRPLEQRAMAVLRKGLKDQPYGPVFDWLTKRLALPDISNERLKGMMVGYSGIDLT